MTQRKTPSRQPAPSPQPSPRGRGRREHMMPVLYHLPFGQAMGSAVRDRRCRRHFRDINPSGCTQRTIKRREPRECGAVSGAATRIPSACASGFPAAAIGNSDASLATRGSDTTSQHAGWPGDAGKAGHRDSRADGVSRDLRVTPSRNGLEDVFVGDDALCLGEWHRHLPHHGDLFAGDEAAE